MIDELYFRGEFDQLSDEEYDLQERHYEWWKAQCLQRLPFERCSPMDFIIRAMRYERLVSLEAPETVVRNEGRRLAEEMVLYYRSVN